MLVWCGVLWSKVSDLHLQMSNGSLTINPAHCDLQLDCDPPTHPPTPPSTPHPYPICSPPSCSSGRRQSVAGPLASTHLPKYPHLLFFVQRRRAICSWPGRTLIRPRRSGPRMRRTTRSSWRVSEWVGNGVWMDEHASADVHDLMRDVATDSDGFPTAHPLPQHPSTPPQPQPLQTCTACCVTWRWRATTSPGPSLRRTQPWPTSPSLCRRVIVLLYLRCLLGSLQAGGRGPTLPSLKRAVG